MSANRCAQLAPTLVQLACLHLIEKHRKDRGHAPTIRELCALRGVASTNGTAECVRALVKKGLLAGEPHAARTLQATALGRAFLRTFTPSAEGGRASFNLGRSAAPESKVGSPAVNNAAGGEG
jgi:SOS-response transcriptional repressor LexA